MKNWRGAILLAGLLGWSAGRPLPAAGQTLEVRAEQTKGTIGDPITLRLTVRLPPGMELIDVSPHTLVPPPKGIRILSTDTLRPTGGGTYTGKARVAFYRIGQQPVPTLALLYRAGPGEPPDTLVHMPVSVEITPILEPGNPPLKDIKPLKAIGGPIWGPLAFLLVMIGGGFWWLRAKGRVGGARTRRHAAALERVLRRGACAAGGDRAVGASQRQRYCPTVCRRSGRGARLSARNWRDSAPGRHYS